MAGIKDALELLSSQELLDIHQIDDTVLPVATAAKLKGVSKAAIYAAIKRGVVVRINGVTLRSLEKYKIDAVKKLSGQVKALKAELEQRKHEGEL